MPFTLRHALRLLCLLLICISTSCSNKTGKSLRIATAANLQFAMKALTKKFSEQTGISCEVILGSSGKLTSQIKAGAPYDLLLSADMRYPEELFKQQLSLGKPQAYATGRLVLWTQGKKPLALPASLSESSLKHIALANPRTAPYGKAAMETLEKLGLAETLKSKLVFGESVAQTNQFINSKAAELGFTAKSSVMAPHLKNQGNWIDIPADYHSPIVQGVVLLKNRKELETEARQFRDFLFSEAAKEILNKFGYASVN